MRQAMRTRRKGFTLIELLIGIAIISLLAMIAIPNVMKASRKARYGRAAADVKTATTAAVTYALDKNVYPTSLAVLRANGYGALGDLDPWQIPYQLSPALLGGGPAVSGQDLYVFSKGASGAGVCPSPFLMSSGPGGSVGYSSVYGAWTGE
jgi:prepilin-type N-terminal cleavage/methylation domain-containing protein